MLNNQMVDRFIIHFMVGFRVDSFLMDYDHPLYIGWYNPRTHHQPTPGLLSHCSQVWSICQVSIISEWLSDSLVKMSGTVEMCKKFQHFPDNNGAVFKTYLVPSLFFVVG